MAYPISGADGRLHLLFEGAGDVIAQYYFPALKKLPRHTLERLDVSFADDSSYWGNAPQLRAKMEGIRGELTAWGAAYIDKATESGWLRHKEARPDAVVIATPDFTHARLAEPWVRRSEKPKRVFIEKPLDASGDAARRLMGTVAPYDPSVLAFDHYRARLLPARAVFDMLGGFFQSGITGFTFYCLEDKSGDDPAFAGAQGGRQGPIENENRVKALDQGLTLDLMPHVIAILARFGHVETIRVTHVRAGKYAGVDGDDAKVAEIRDETFAEIRFQFIPYGDKLPPAQGVAYLGKGVKGSKLLGSEYDRNTKLLEVRSADGRRATFDFRKKGNGASKASLIDEAGISRHTFDLNPDPYLTFLESVTSSDGFDDRITLPIETGKKILEVMEDMRYPMRALEAPLPTCPCGLFGRRSAPFLEDLLPGGCYELPLLYGVPV